MRLIDSPQVARSRGAPPRWVDVPGRVSFRAFRPSPSRGFDRLQALQRAVERRQRILRVEGTDALFRTTGRITGGGHELGERFGIEEIVAAAEPRLHLPDARRPFLLMRVAARIPFPACGIVLHDALVDRVLPPIEIGTLRGQL